MEAWLDERMASGEAPDPNTRWIAGARYGHIHLTPAHAARARAYAQWLGLEGMGGGLRPVDDRS